MKSYSTLSLNATSQGSFGMQYITFGIQPTSSIANMFGPWLNGFRPKLKSRILVGATAICWTIWLNRNDMVFEGGKSNTPSVPNFKTFQQFWRVKIFYV